MLQTLSRHCLSFLRLLAKPFQDEFVFILSLSYSLHTHKYSNTNQVLHPLLPSLLQRCCCCWIAVAKIICQLNAFRIFPFLLLLSLFLLDIVDVIATCKHCSPFPYFTFLNFLLIIGCTASIRTHPFVSFSNKLFFPQAALHGCLNICKCNFSFTNSPFQISSR